MKKISIFSMAAATMLLAACATDDDTNDKGKGGEQGQSKFLAVNIMNVGATPTGTRAIDGYEDGTEAESKINKVRFYFFHADGSPYYLQNTSDETTSGTNANWLETVNDINGTDKDPDHTVEQITKKVLVINGISASAPASVIAVVNPGTLTSTTLGNEAINLNTLRQTLTDTKFTNGTGSAAKDFVMSNSVYLDAGSSVCSSIISGHVANSAEAALNSPVDIYVERVVAKVQAGLNNAKFVKGNGSNWDAGKYGIEVGTYGASTKVYAVVDGWGLADEDGKAEIEKQIETSWNSADLGITPWTTADYHRSFWSKSVPFTAGDGGNQPVNHTFSYFTSAATLGDSNESGTPLYTLPNTPNSVTDFSTPYESYLTKFLVAAHLRYVDDKGNGHNAEICTYKGVQYLGVENLKTQIANDYNKYYTLTSTGTHESLKPEELTFSTSSTQGTSLKDYQVVATLKDTSIKYYVNKGSETDPDWQEVTAATVNKSLEESPAEVRTDGMAYYYIPVRHLATDPTKLGYYGIVRNHFYKINLNTIAGFGTPVYDPNKVIDPTIPSDSNTYLAAEIKVLQWRVVSQDVDLDKTQK